MNRLLAAFLQHFIKEGTLEAIGASGTSRIFGNGKESSISIRFTDRSAEHQLLLNPPLALGQLFMDGRLVVERGTIYDLLLIATRNLALQPQPGLLRMQSNFRRALRSIHQRNSERRAKRNVAHHYDLDGRLYDLFLDADRQYSCAYFEHPEQNIEEAQLAKKRHIAAKLLVEPGHHVLDIGSGWGGLALYLAEQCGAQITGVTLSDEQLSIARRRAVKKGLASAVDFQLQDYRAIQGQFDRIVSVGMFEHVGVNYYDAFFSKAADLLADDGVMLVHSIGSIDGPSVTNPWVAKYIFPGGYLPALSEVLPAIERAGLIVTDIEILRLHYAQTLKAWRERFVSHRGEAAAIYDERFCRMWEFYLAGFEAAFRHGGLMVFQIQLAKRLDAVPLTRDYIAHREAALRLRETQSPALCVAAE
jgi:cyclopropane-fatty-acyl-phospholipid synthase